MLNPNTRTAPMALKVDAYINASHWKAFVVSACSYSYYCCPVIVE